MEKPSLEERVAKLEQKVELAMKHLAKAYEDHLTFQWGRTPLQECPKQGKDCALCELYKEFIPLERK